MTDVTGYGERVGRVLRSTSDGRVGFWCPGCDDPHYVRVRVGDEHPSWIYNNNADAPTFTPSILVTYNGPDAGQVDEDGDHAPPARCHSFVTDGQIQFLSDCTHSLAGQTVALPDFNR